MSELNPSFFPLNISPLCSFSASPFWGPVKVQVHTVSSHLFATSLLSLLAVIKHRRVDHSVQYGEINAKLNKGFYFLFKVNSQSAFELDSINTKLKQFEVAALLGSSCL